MAGLYHAAMRPHLHLPIVLLGALLALLAGCAHRPSSTRIEPTVVLVSIDGLPARLLDDGTLPTLDALARRGVRARWMNPSYPTLTFPNHYTLVTGLRPDHHGIVHNDMHDAALGRFVSKEDSARDGRWWGGEPIWLTLQRQGGIAATMFWPGSEADIAGQHPRHFRRFDRSVGMEARVDQVLAWLDLPRGQRPQLVTLYFEHYDVAAHATSTRSPQAIAQLRHIDDALARLQSGLQARGIAGRTDVLVVSDHGMADVAAANTEVLADLGTGAYRIEYAGQIAGIHPAPERVTEVEAALLGRKPHHQCWRKAQAPRAWHFGTHRRIPPIICQADAGWRMVGPRSSYVPPPLKAEHGYAPDAPEMRGIFVAAGPSFRSGVVLPAFDNVDVYPLLARLLGIVPASNDGDARGFAPALTRRQ